MSGGGNDYIGAICGWLTDNFYHGRSLDIEIHLASATYIMLQNTDLLFRNVEEIREDSCLFEIVLYYEP